MTDCRETDLFILFRLYLLAAKVVCRIIVIDAILLCKKGELP